MVVEDAEVLRGLDVDQQLVQRAAEDAAPLSKVFATSVPLRRRPSTRSTTRWFEPLAQGFQRRT